MASPAAAANFGTQRVTATAVVVGSLGITAAQNLQFGNLIPAATAGTAVVNVNTGAVTTTGGVTAAGGVTSFASFQLYDSTLGGGTITYPGTATLTRIGGTQTMTVNNITYTLTQGTLSGFYTFNLGGTLNVAGGQRVGAYTGSLTVTVAFN